MKILFKYPTRSRPEWFKKTLEMYYSKMSGKYKFEFIISLNTDDPTMNTEEIKRYLDSKNNLKYYHSPHRTKIQAINADMDGVDFDILILVSDDMIPVAQDYDDVIVSSMLKYFPDMDGALHFDDDCCGKDKTITLSIMGKKLYDVFGYIYHPSYKSFYCDNEFTDEVYRMNKAVYISQVIIKHDWRGWEKKDLLYKRNSALGKDDESIYNERKQKGFLNV